MKLNLSSDNDFKSNVLEKKFSVKTSSSQISCIIPKEKKFKVENLFEFRRITGDLTLSLVFLLFVIFLFLNFNTESGWDTRNLPQKRVGKILKQQWVGPLLCMVILIPATFINLYESFKSLKKSQRLKIPNKIQYEISQWIRSIEFIVYFLIYTFAIEIFGYLISTMIFANFLTFRLGYRTKKWILTSTICSFVVVIIFRSILQIKTPVNIWLYKYFPENIEVFMKIYF